MSINNQKIKHLVLLTVILLTLMPTLAYSSARIERLAIDTDLPEGPVNCLAQDEAGFIWIGTWKGLFRYDGYSAINFSTINPAFNALKIGQIHISNNTLWVGTFVNGLFKIDLSTYQITNYNTNSDTLYRITDNNIIAITVMPDKTVLVGSERGGMNTISAEGYVEKTYTVDSHPHILPNRQVTKLRPIDSTWVAIGNYSFYLFNTKTEETIKFTNSIFNTFISDIVYLNEGRYLISSLERLILVDTRNELKIETLLEQRIRAITHFDDKYLIATTTGIHIFDPKNGNLEHFAKDLIKNAQLEINSFLISKDETLIAGTESGLHAIVHRLQQFKHLDSKNGNENPDIISCIDKQGNTLYAGSWGKGLLKINNGELEPVRFSNPIISAPRFIFSLKTSHEKVWFSGKNELGVYSFSNQNEPYNLKHYKTFKGINNENLNFTTTCIVESKNNSILLGTWEGLILNYDIESDQFVVIRDRNGELPSSINFSIFSILEDNEGYTWAALSGGGVIKLKIINNTIISQEIITVNNGLANNFATTLYQSRNQKIWIGTEAGLSVYSNGQIENLYNKDIIFDIQSIAEDPIGFLWIGTQKGLVRINSNNHNESFKHFGTSDGLKNYSYYLNSIFVDTDDTFYFGGYNGIDFFTPYKIEFNFKKPVPKITNFALFNEKIYPFEGQGQQIINENITTASTINLKHNQNTFSFEFSNLEYQNQDKCQFAYKLDGVDNDWNYRNAKQRNAYYTKLSPGNYTFHLKSTNNDGLWSDEKVKLNINILPPFWATTLAYIVYFVAAMLTIFSIIYYRLMKVHEKHQQKLKEIEYKKQKELDELKLKFFTNISHEFRTPLTLILGPLARLLEIEKNNPFKETHLMIFRNASRLLQLTNRILDFRKNEKEQLKLKVTPTNVSDFMYNIFLFFNYEAQKREIDYRFKTNFEELRLIDREFMESVAFNLLSNAFKYTPNGRSITVGVDSNHEGIKIWVADTGPGINNEELKLIFDRFYSTTKRNSAGIGLSFSKRLIELHKGQLLVESQVGQGSMFSVILPPDTAYNDEEKQTAESKELVADWKKIDQSMQDTLSTKIDKLKNLFEKDEMIALIVDDNFEVRQFIASLLDNNFKIIEASNGLEALNIAFELIPDIIISDVMMPAMNGYELCQQLKSDERTDHIPIILTTVLSTQDDRNEGLTKGADSYIPKPIDPKHLLIRVNKLIENQLKLKKKFKLDNYSFSKEEKETQNDSIHPLVEKAHQIVLKNLDNSDYNIDDFCNDLGLSRMQLYRKFKAITGLSANSFIRKVRINKAAELLKTGNYTVKEVTYDVGFIDLKYFRKCFHDEFGVNPSDYAQTQHKT